MKKSVKVCNICNMNYKLSRRCMFDFTEFSYRRI